jgi:NTE family protein
VKLGDWLSAAPFSLAMSSGFFGFFAHTGMLDTLLVRDLHPQLVAGSSAGAMVAAAYAAGFPMSEMAKRLNSLTREEFWDPKPGLGLLAGQKFDRILREMAPTTNVDDAVVPLKISVFDILRRRTVVMERGDMVKAVRASCAVPGLFHPVWIERRAYWDGGILDRPGLAGIAEGERTLFHHIASPGPWSRPSKAPPLPRRTNMVSLVIDGLPRVSPWHLPNGRTALGLAREATNRALELPIVDGVVRIAA